LKSEEDKQQMAACIVVGLGSGLGLVYECRWLRRTSTSPGTTPGTTASTTPNTTPSTTPNTTTASAGEADHYLQPGSRHARRPYQPPDLGEIHGEAG